MVIDTVCYDPTIQNSPVYPLVISPINILTGSASTGNISTGSLSMIDDEMFDYSSLQFDIISLIYDPDGSDTDRESIVIKFLSGTDSVLLDNFRLRVGTTNKRIYGTILS